MADDIIEATRQKWHNSGSFDLEYSPLGILTSEPLYEQQKNCQNGTPEPFNRLWSNLAGRSCTDPWDNVFTLLGLSQDLLEILPTYDENLSNRIQQGNQTLHYQKRKS
jgi:hypothetical protein